MKRPAGLISKLLVTTGLVVAPQWAHSQAQLAAGLTNLVNVGKTSVDGLSSFASYQEKVMGGSSQGTFNPFAAKAIPKDAAAEIMYGWERHKLSCVFKYKDPHVGNWSHQWVNSNWSKNMVKHLSMGGLHPTNFWPEDAVRLDFAIEYLSNGRIEAFPGRFLNRVTFEKTGAEHITPGWDFEANVGSYEPIYVRNKDSEPVAEIALLLEFKVGNMSHGRHKFYKKYYVTGDGRMRQETKGFQSSSDGSSEANDSLAVLNCKGVSQAEIEKQEAINEIKFE